MAGVKAVLLAAVLLAAAPSATHAQPDDATAPSDAKHPTVLGSVSNGSRSAADERDFVRQVAASDLAEQQMGRLAAAQAGSSSVIEFGRSVADDAAQDLAALKGAAGSAPLPDGPDAAHRTVLDRLRPLYGSGFDDAYLSAVQKDQSDTAKLMQEEAKGGQDQSLLFYAQRQLPTIQAHVDEAKDLQTRAPGHSKGPPDVNIDRSTEQRLQQQQADRLRAAPPR